MKTRIKIAVIVTGTLALFAIGSTAFATNNINMTKDYTLENTSFTEVSEADFKKFEHLSGIRISEEDFQKIEHLSEDEFMKQLEKLGTIPTGDEAVFIAWDAISPAFDDFIDPTQGIISEKDWDTLSMKQIDEKMKKAGKDTIGDSQNPLYTLTVKQIDNLSNAQWEKIDAKYNELYGDFEEDYIIDFEEDDMGFDDFSDYKDEILIEVKSDYQAIKKDVSKENQKKIETSLKKLEKIDIEDTFFQLLDEIILLLKQN